VVGFPHDVKGEGATCVAARICAQNSCSAGVCCYVILKQGVDSSEALEKNLRSAVREVKL
jgi:acyl-coenzyme A synthetase/AMP-(fatty) acid ligase